MSKPTIEARFGGYLFSWLDEKLTIQVSRIRVHSSGQVTGEILIETTLPGTKEHVHQAGFNFSSSQSRSALAKSLSMHYTDWQWPFILEALSVNILRLSREGEPVIELDNISEISPPEYFLEPLIMQGCPNVIYGEPQQGKSTIALIVALSLIAPWQPNVNYKSPSQRVNTLYLDWEADWNIIQWNFKRISKGNSLPALKLDYRRCSIPLIDDLEKIGNIIDNHAIQAIIIDSIGPAAGTKLASDEPAIHLFQALRQLQRTSFLIGQTSKDKDGKKSIYGSTFFEYLSRNVWQIRSVKDKDRIECGLFHAKSNYSRHFNPIGIDISHFDDAIMVDKFFPESVPEFLERMGWEARIKEALSRGAMSLSDMVNEMGATVQEKNTVKVFLNRLQGRGTVIRIDNKWGLVAS